VSVGEGKGYQSGTEIFWDYLIHKKWRSKMLTFNEDTRVKIPATIQFLRLNYNYQSY